MNRGCQLGRRLLFGVATLCAATLLFAPGASASGELSFVDCLQAAPARDCGGVDHAAPSLAGVDDVAVSPNGKDVFATSRRSDAIMLLLRGRGGTLRPARKVAVLGGASLRQATSVAVSPDGHSVYATFARPGAILVLQRSPHLLTPKQLVVEGSNGAPDTTPGLSGAFDVTTSSDGRNVYVASATSSALVVFRRGADGLLSFEECISDGAPLAEDCSSYGGSVPGLLGADGVAVDPSGNDVYVTGGRSNTLVAFSRDKRDGSLNEIGCIENAGSTSCVASGPPPPARDLAGGAIVSSPGLGDPERIAVSGDGADVYLASAKPGAVVSFARNRASGALTPIGCIGASSAAGCGQIVAGLSEAFGIALSPQGRDAYVTGFNDGAVLSFARSTTGGLSYRSCIAKARPCRDRQASAAGATGIATSPDGNDVYVAAYGAGALMHLTRSRPVLSDLHLDRRGFRPARRGPSITARSGGGTRVTYTDSVWAATRFIVERAVAGKRRGHRCVHAGRGHAQARCKLLVPLGGFTRRDRTGTNSFRFSGRLAGSALAPGEYELVAVADDAAGPGEPVRRAFQVLP